ncbi:hypothetical protein J22TS3_09330 [Paenibacillus sp. J22TS3]|nr:hypothetical protein J22TS3_09330 [Paenibacillus sp. J22TS3]
MNNNFRILIRNLREKNYEKVNFKKDNLAITSRKKGKANSVSPQDNNNSR